MLDIKFIRENKELVAEAARKKQVDFSVETLLAVDDKRKAALLSIEGKRAEQNVASERIASASPEARAVLIAEMKLLKGALEKEEESFKEIMREWQGLMVRVPNVPDMSVPEGGSDADNQEVRVWGEKPVFAFSPKSHVEIMESLHLADFTRGAKVSGFRGYFLIGAGAELNFALWKFVIDFWSKKNFTFMVAPSLLKREPFIGTGFLPQSEEDLYKTQDGEYLAGTSEVAAMGYYMDEVLDVSAIPSRFFAFSACFRREAGSHGRDTKGIIRVHEFFKFEQIVLCEASHEESVRFHEEITKNSEEFIQALGLPYRVVVNCGGDLGLGQVKKYDIECWVPSEDKYRETHSSSYFHDFQTRRLNIRYKDREGKTRFAHSLNNTAAATPRLLVSILENGQQADGSVLVPEVLRPYLGKEVIR